MGSVRVPREEARADAVVSIPEKEQSIPFTT